MIGNIFLKASVNFLDRQRKSRSVVPKRLEVFALQPSLKNFGGISGLWSPAIHWDGKEDSEWSEKRCKTGASIIMWNADGCLNLEYLRALASSLAALQEWPVFNSWQHKHDQTLSIKTPARGDTRSHSFQETVLLISLQFCAVVVELRYPWPYYLSSSCWIFHKNFRRTQPRRRNIFDSVRHDLQGLALPSSLPYSSFLFF